MKRRESDLTRFGEIVTPDLLPPVSEGLRLGAEIAREDIAYTHPVFLQCFLPTRHTEKNKLRWQANWGRASLVIHAGELINPRELHEFRPRIVPAGPKARFSVAYVNDYIQREKTRNIDMGRSLRKAMDRIGIPITGPNGKALQWEVENFAAANIVLGKWTDDGPYQDQAFVSDRISFWLEKDPRQRTIWEPEMVVSQQYFDAVRDGDRMAPFYWPALLGLSDDVRAMDIHCFLVYSLHKGLAHDFPISARALHGLFGRDINLLRHFWPRFLASLAKARKWYPEARIEVGNDCITLKNSPPLIPRRKLGH